MQIPKIIRNNLRFLLVEVNTQLKRLLTYMDTESVSVSQKIISRGGYTANLRLRIQNACLVQISQNLQSDNMTMRAVSAIASDLERIMDLSRECVNQMGYLRPSHKIDLTVHKPLIRKISRGIGFVEKSLFDNDTELALKLAGVEGQLDKACKKLLQKYTNDLKQKKNTEDLVTALFVAHTVEQMGDSLLNISEAIISSNIGQPMDIQRYQFLKETVGRRDDHDLSDIEIKPVADTRSGSGISSVNYTDEHKKEQLVIFKDGEKKKLKEELEGVEKWHQTCPGVAPQILTYKKEGDSAALLIEHLHGLTFEQIVLKSSDDTKTDAMKTLKKTLFSVWGATLKEKAVPAGFVEQVRKRLGDVYAVHPNFRQSESGLCGYKVPGLEQRLLRAEKLEKKVYAPFSVLIHGDFNVDNVIYDPDNRKIKFIDLHRSSYMDYVQDVSVFMVSNYRLQILDKPVRQRILHQVEAFYKIASQFAKKQKDDTFEVRLALGLARSFLTSTRFILDKSMATQMFMKATYLIDRVIELNSNQYNRYRLPVKDIFSD